MGDDAGCKNLNDAISAENALCEVPLSAAIFAERKLAEQQSRQLFAMASTAVAHTRKSPELIDALLLHSAVPRTQNFSKRQSKSDVPSDEQCVPSTALC